MSWELYYKFLEENGWEVECQSPFEIRTKDGSFASGEAAMIVLEHLKSGYGDNEQTFEEWLRINKNKTE